LELARVGAVEVAVLAAVEVPVVAGGGVMNAADMASVIGRGAVAAQVARRTWQTRRAATTSTEQP
jgi:imidazole glycerol phosphate synthase subunit HisF